MASCTCSVLVILSNISSSLPPSPSLLSKAGHGPASRDAIRRLAQLRVGALPRARRTPAAATAPAELGLEASAPVGQPGAESHSTAYEK
jgi:hypothetical protein